MRIYNGVALLLAALISSCLLVSCTPSGTSGFPDTEIVYQSFGWEEPSIGFVDADGSKKTLVTLDDYYPNRPIWSAQSDTVIFIQPIHPIGALGDVNTYGGRISIWQENRGIRQCKNRDLWNVSSVETLPHSTDGHQGLIVNAWWRIILFDFDRCREIERYLDLAGDQDNRIEGAALSSDQRYIVYTETSAARSSSPTFTIRILETITGDVIEIGEGINPRWSPDDSWVAYTRLDGIYMMTPDGNNKRQLVEYNAGQGTKDFDLNVPPPAPQWSPDGSWLIYHKCTAPDLECEGVHDYSIFKVNIETGIESKILDSGLFPYWRLDM